MDVTEATQMLLSLAEEVRATAEQREALSARIEQLGQVILGILRLYPELTETDGGREIAGMASDLLKLGFDFELRPKGAEAARVVLEAAPRRWFSVSEVARELSVRGWLPESENPTAAVRAALERLKTMEGSYVIKGATEPGGTVIYCYDPPVTLKEIQGD